jgi:uncharacterized protein (TIGR02594 family)
MKLPNFKLESDGTDCMSPFKWALKHLGESELPGKQHNSEILFYHSFTTYKATTDEVPWCSSFMNAAAFINGFKGTESAAARSWLDYGAKGDGSVGDICILKRVGGNHVAFIAAPYHKDDQFVTLLGGNQSDQVKVSKYLAANILAIRRFLPVEKSLLHPQQNSLA